MQVSACPQTLPTPPSYGASFASPISAQPPSLTTPKPHSPSGLAVCTLLFSLDRLRKKPLSLLPILRAAALGGHHVKLTDCETALRVLCQLSHHWAIPWQWLTSSSLIQTMYRVLTCNFKWWTKFLTEEMSWVDTKQSDPWVSSKDTLGASLSESNHACD